MKTKEIWVAFDRALHRDRISGELEMCFAPYRAEVSDRRWPGVGERVRMRELWPFGSGNKLCDPSHWLTVRIDECIPHAVGNKDGYAVTLLHETPAATEKQGGLFAD